MNPNGETFSEWCRLAGYEAAYLAGRLFDDARAAWLACEDPAAFRALRDAAWAESQRADRMRIYRDILRDAIVAIQAARIYARGTWSPLGQRFLVTERDLQGVWTCVMLAAEARNRAKTFLVQGVT
jgi:hypothetical protein